jgi:type I restriction enzyme S subunit
MTYKTTTLDTFVTLQRGYDLPAQDRIPGVIPIIAANGQVGFHNVAKVNAQCVVLGRSGSVGNPQLISEPFWPLNTTLFVKDFHGNSPTFVYYVLKTIDFKSFDAGGTVPTLNRNHLTQIEVPLLDLAHQEAISGVLQNLDAKISSNNALSKTLEDIAQTIFKSWFIDFDPVKAKMAGEKPAGMDAATAALFPDSMEESEMGLIPKGWRIGSLEEIVDLQGGYAFKSSSWTDCGVPVIKIGSVKPGYVDLTQVSYVETSLAEGISDDYRIPAGSLVVGLTGYVGQVGLVRTHEPVPLVNQRVAKFKPRSGDWKIPFIYCFTRDPKFKVIVEELSTGTAQQNVSNSQILSIPLVIPNNEIQKSFEDSLTPLFNQIINLADENESLKSLRDALLPRLISGELQIPEEMLAS